MARSGSTPRDAHRSANSAADTARAAQNGAGSTGPVASPSADAATSSRAAALVGNDLLAGAAIGADLGGIGAVAGAELALGAAGISATDSGSASLSHMRDVLRRADSGVPDDDVDVAMRLARASGGQQLPSQHKARLEAAFDHSFDHVRVHVGGTAARASQLLRAHAFALGSDVFFNSGTYAPGTARGDRLLAHELTHVVQHDERRLPSGGGVSHPSDPHEVEAYGNEGAIVRRLAQLDRLPEDLRGDVVGAALDAPIAAPLAEPDLAGADLADAQSAAGPSSAVRPPGPPQLDAPQAPSQARPIVEPQPAEVAQAAPAPAVAAGPPGVSLGGDVGGASPVGPATGGDAGGDAIAVGGLALRRATSLPAPIAARVSERFASPAADRRDQGTAQAAIAGRGTDVTDRDLGDADGAHADPFTALFHAVDAIAGLDGGLPAPDSRALEQALGADLASRAAVARSLAVRLAGSLGLSGSPPIHLDAAAAELTARLGVAGVYHQGAIHLDPARFDPGSFDGRVTLAHELVHAAQDRLPYTQGATLGLAEFEAHALADDLAAGGAIEAPVVALPAGAVATEGDASGLSGIWEALKAKMQALNEEQATKAADLKKDPKDLSETSDNKGDVAKKWRKGLKATANELEDSDAGETLWDKINDEEPYSAELARVKKTGYWTDLVDMYKSTLKDDEDGAAKRAEWDSLFADKGFRSATKKMWRILAADAKKEAKLSAEEEDAAVQAEEAKAKGPADEATPEEVPQGDQPGGADASDAGLFGGFSGLLGDLDVAETPPATPEWDKAKSDTGERPGYDRVAKELGNYNASREKASETKGFTGGRFMQVTGGLLAAGAGGFIDGMKDGAVDKLKEKLVFDHVDGFLNKTIGAKAGLGKVDFVSKGLAVYDLVTGDPFGDVSKNYDKAGASWGKAGGYFSADAWASCDSRSDYVGVFFAGLADLAQAICDTLAFVEDILSKISTVLWAVGLALIIVGFCTLWLGWGASLIVAGKKVISIARFIEKIAKVLSAIAKPVKAFGMFANVLASYLVPEELFVERFGKAQEGVTEFSKDAGDVIGSSTVEHATDKYEAHKKKKEAEKAEGGTPASEAEKEKGKAEGEQVMADAQAKLKDQADAIEQVKDKTEQAKKDKEKADNAAGADAGADKPKTYKDRVKEGMKEKYGHLSALNVFTKKGRQQTADDIKKSMKDVGATWTVLKMELGSASTTDFRELKQVSDASIKSGEDAIKRYDMLIEDASSDLQKAKDDLKKVSGDADAKAEAQKQLDAAKSKLDGLEQTRRDHDINVAELKSFSKAIETSPVAFDQISSAERADAEKKATDEVGKTQQKITEIDKQILANDAEIKKLHNNSKGKSKKTSTAKKNKQRIDELKAENKQLSDQKKSSEKQLSEDQSKAGTLQSSGGAYKPTAEGQTKPSVKERWNNKGQAYADWVTDMKARYTATSKDSGHKSPAKGTSKKLWSLLGSGITMAAGDAPEQGTDERGLESKKQEAGNTRPFDGVLSQWDNIGKNSTTVLNNLFGNADLNMVLMNEAPITDLAELDTKYDEAEYNIKKYLNHYEIAYEASVTEKQIAAEVQVKEELDASAGETVAKGLDEMQAPLQKGKGDAQNRASQIAGADTGTQDSDPEAKKKTDEAAGEMNANKKHMSGGSSGSETAGAAGDSTNAQDQANKESNDGKDKGTEASNDQVVLLDTLNTGRDTLSNQTVQVREELKAKTEEEKSTLQTVKAEKAEHLALAADHHSKGESAAGEYNKSLSTAVGWADKYKAAREGWAAGIGG